MTTETGVHVPKILQSPVKYKFTDPQNRPRCCRFRNLENDNNAQKLKKRVDELEEAEQYLAWYATTKLLSILHQPASTHVVTQTQDKWQEIRQEGKHEFSTYPNEQLANDQGYFEQQFPSLGAFSADTTLSIPAIFADKDDMAETGVSSDDEWVIVDNSDNVTHSGTGTNTTDRHTALHQEFVLLSPGFECAQTYTPQPSSSTTYAAVLASCGTIAAKHADRNVTSPCSSRYGGTMQQPTITTIDQANEQDESTKFEFRCRSTRASVQRHNNHHHTHHNNYHCPHHAAAAAAVSVGTQLQKRQLAFGGGAKAGSIVKVGDPDQEDEAGQERGKHGASRGKKARWLAKRTKSFRSSQIA